MVRLGYVGRLSVLFPIALGSALTGATLVHRYYKPDLVRPQQSQTSTDQHRPPPPT